MKKIKLLAALMALILCASMVLTACGKKEEEKEPITIADIMNAEYAADEDKIVSSSTKLSFQGEYDFADSNFVVTEEAVKATETVKAHTMIRVYNAATGKEVASLNRHSEETKATETTPAYITNYNYYVDVISEEYFAVLAVVAKTGSSLSGPTYVSDCFGCQVIFNDNVTNTLTIRDAEGKVVETFENSVLMNACNSASSSLPGIGVVSFDTAYLNGEDSLAYEYKDKSEFAYKSNNDLFLISSKLYRFDSDFNVTLVKDFGLAKQPANLLSMSKIGDFYLGRSSSNTVNVYDKDLNELFKYTVPEYAKESFCSLLANGNLLIQYVVQLDQNDEEYDMRADADGRFDIVTVLVNAEGVTELEADYMIGKLAPSVAGLDGQKVYSDIVENLAFIYPIGENKMLDTSAANRKLVLFSNAGEVTDEVEIEGNISEAFPEHFFDDYYRVALIDGSYAVYDKEGKLVSELSGTALAAKAISGDMLLVGKNIYNIKGEKEKELKNVVYKSCGKSLILIDADIKSATYSLYVDGSTKSIGTSSIDPENKTAYSSIVPADGYYYTVMANKDEKTNKTTYTYTYYNEKGDKLVSTEYKLSACASTEDLIIFTGKEEKKTVDPETKAEKTEIVDVFYRFDIK